MIKDWKLIAAGLKLSVPESELEKAQAALSELELAFQPLLPLLSSVTEPAFHFECHPEEDL